MVRTKRVKTCLVIRLVLASCSSHCCYYLLPFITEEEGVKTPGQSQSSRAWSQREGPERALEADHPFQVRLEGPGSHLEGGTSGLAFQEH